MKILIAEDELTTANGLKKLIEKFDGDYRVAGIMRNGVQALAYLKNNFVDILLTDICMPDMDGISLIKSLKEINFTGEIVILSGYSDFKYTREALKLKIFDYLLKPVTRESLKCTLDSAYSALEKARKENDPSLKAGKAFEQFCTGGYYLQSSAGERLLLFLKSCPAHTVTTAIICTDSYGCDQDSFVLMERAMERITIHLPDTHILLCPGADKSLMNVLVLTKGSMDWRSAFSQYLTYLSSISHPDSFLFYEEPASIEKTQESFRTLSGLISWRINLTPGAFTPTYLSSIRLHPFTYPKMMEESIIQNILIQNQTEAVTQTSEFIRYLTQNTYSPKKIYDAMVKLVSAILYVVKKENYSLFSSIHQLDLIECVEKCASLTAFQSLVENMISDLTQKQAEKSTLGYSKLTIDAIGYIETMFGSDISLDWTAEKLGVTTEHLSRRFSSEAGKSFTSFLTEYRIQMAKKYLTSGKYKIYEAATMSGFQDAKYFSKVFKKYTNKLPSFYLKK